MVGDLLGSPSVIGAVFWGIGPCGSGRSASVGSFVLGVPNAQDYANLLAQMRPKSENDRILEAMLLRNAAKWPQDYPWWQECRRQDAEAFEDWAATQRGRR